MSVLKMCCNWKVLVGLSALAVGLYALAPNTIAGFLPVLGILACPLMMLVMMVAMRGMGSTTASPPGSTTVAPQAGGRAEQLALLRAQLDGVADQQAALASQIEQLEAGETSAEPAATPPASAAHSSAVVPQASHR